MDFVGRLLLDQLVAEADVMLFDRDVGDVGGDARALRQLLSLTEPFGLRHGVSRDIAHRDIATLGDQLPRKLATHTRAASGDDGILSGEILHGRTRSFLVGNLLRANILCRTMMRLAKLAAAIYRCALPLLMLWTAPPPA